MSKKRWGDLRAHSKNVRPPFDAFTIALHWITALIVLALLGSGLLYGLVEERSWAAALLRVHRSLGVTVWILSVIRLGWRFAGAQFPEFPSSMTPIHRLGARLSEYTLYALLLLQPITGTGQSIWRGRAVEVFAWSIPQLVPKDLALAAIFHEAHEIGAWCMIVLVGLHATAALVHHFVLRDDVLETMAPVFRQAAEPVQSDRGLKSG